MLRTGLGALLVAVMAMLMLSASAEAARKKTKPPPPPPLPQCGGVDMLAELSTNDPVLYQKILSEGAATQNDGALLWKISRDGTAASHLFGTIHLSDPRVAIIPAKAQKALDQAKTVIVEVADLSPQSSAMALSAAMRLAVFTDGRSLDALLSPEDFAKVKQAVAGAGMPEQAARLFKPWIVSMLMSGTACEREKVKKGALVQDMKIAEVAKRRRVPLIGLETAESQLKALASVSDQQQLDMLKSSLPYLDRTQDLIETTLQLYLKRNITTVWPFQIALAEKAGFGGETFSGFQQKLVIGRNMKMRDNVLSHLQKGGAFVAVGALHLPGLSGLIELLREAGFTLTPVD